MRYLLALALLLATPVSGTSVQTPTRIDGTTCTGFVASVVGGITVYTCTAGPPPPGAPTGCSATINNSSVANFPTGGGAAALDVNCTQSSGLTYQWTKNGANASNAKSWNETLPPNGTASAVNHSYAVSVCQGAACTTPGAVTATVAAAGGGSPSSCPGFNQTFSVVMPWSSTPVRQYADMGVNDAVVVSFTTGNNGSTASMPRIASAEYQSGPSSRIAVLSATPCDWGPQAAAGATIVSNSVTAIFAIAPGSGMGYYPVLNKNTTYYLNIKNSPNPSCANTGFCKIFIDLITQGL